MWKNAKVIKTRKQCVHNYEYYFMCCPISCTAFNPSLFFLHLVLNCKTTERLSNSLLTAHSLPLFMGKSSWFLERESSRKKQVWLEWEYEINRTTSLGQGVVPTKQTALWIRSSLAVYCSNSERTEQQERHCGEGTDLVALQGFSVSPQVPL